jgi:protein TonB
MRGIHIAALAGLLAALSSPVAARDTPAIPKGNPGLWVQTDDYPPSALREEGQGVVRFKLAIDAAGVPVNCTVTQSSGRSDLDDTACQLIVERARFDPAKDARGRPVAGTYENSVRWQIPQDRPAPQPGELVASIVVEADGSVSSCKVEKATGTYEVAAAHMCEHPGSFEPILDDKGTPVRKRLRTTLKLEYEDVP